MNKKKNLVLLICFCIFYLCNFDIVYGATSINVGSSAAGVPDGCSDGNCMSLGTSGIRVALVDKNGKQKGLSFDVWLFSDGSTSTTDDTKIKSSKKLELFSFGTSVKYVLFDKHRLRQDFIGLSESADTVNKSIIINDYSSVDITPIDSVFPNILDGQDFSVGYEGNVYNGCSIGVNCGYTNSHLKKSSRTPNSAETIIKLIYKNIDERYGDDASITPGGSDDYLKIILSLTKNSSISSNQLKNYSIQFEPLVMWGNTVLWAVDNEAGYVFMGTTSEITYFFQKTNNHTVAKFCKGENKSTEYVSGAGSTVCAAGAGKGGHTAFNKDANQKAFNNVAGVGIYSDKEVYDENNNGALLFRKITNVTTSTISHYTAYNFSDEYGVGFVSLSDFDKLTGSCNDDARTIIFSGNEMKSDYKSNYINKLKESSYIVDACFDASGNFKTKDCYQLLPEYIEKVGGYIPTSVEYYVGDKKVTENIDLCQPVSCNGALATIKTKFTYDKDDEGNKKTAPTTNYAVAVDYIYKKITQEIIRFKDSDTIESNDFLDYNVYNALGREAKCDTALLNCPLEGSGDISCGESHSTKTFKIKDNTSDECEYEGISYSGVSSVKKVVQSAIDFNYENNEVFCFEEVDFTLPGKPKKNEAGTLLGWGTSKNVIETGYFGKMTVTKRCEFKNFNTGDEKDNINIRWFENIDTDTEILLNYHDRANYAFNKRMDIKFTDFKIDNISGINEKTFAGKIYGDSYRHSTASYHYRYGEQLYKDLKNYECNEENNYCKDIKELETSVEYSIMYPSSLIWYADKSNPFDPASADELEVHEEPFNVEGNYIYLGYGLVTSFADPTCEFGGTIEEWRSEEQLKEVKDNSGELSITIKNIGTRIRPNDPDHHHFDKIFQLEIGEEGGISDNKYKSGDNLDNRDYLYYNCPFDISNRIFGSEYGGVNNCNPTESGSPEGLDVVFRTVNLMEDDDVDSLLKAFPSRAGSGRLFGYNWFKLTNGDKFNTTRIYNLLKDDIYEEKEPMYHIELTPGNIKKIRDDNKKLKNEGKNPYANMDNDTYLFSTYMTESQFFKKYDVNGDRAIDAVDAMSILVCNNDPDYYTWCDNVISNNLGKEYAQIVLQYYADMQAELIDVDEDKPSIHVSSLYLDTLKDKYGLNGVCMDTDAAGRLVKYKKNGCHYDDRPEIELSEEDLGKSYYYPAKACVINFEKSGENVYSCLSKFYAASETGFSYSGSSEDLTKLNEYMSSDYSDDKNDGDIVTTIGGFYNQHPADEDDGDIRLSADFTG